MNTKLQELNAIELFSGIGGFRIAADKSNIRTIWANDLNSSACAVYRDRFGSAELVEGNIDEHISEIPPHDLLSAGFPCQPFSAAGKKQGIRDARGTLFQRIVDVLQAQQPQYFVLENVKRLLTMEGGVHFATVLAALSTLNYFVEWRVLNAKHFGLAQNRERVVIVGRKLEDADVAPLSFIRLLTSEDAATLPARAFAILHNHRQWKAVEQHDLKFANWGVAVAGSFFAHEVDNFSDAASPKYLKDILLKTVPAQFDLTDATLHRLDKNEPVDKFVNGVEIISNQSGGARMGYTIFGVKGLAPTLTASTSRHYERYQVGDRYRRLTPSEYARLQGFPDDHCATRKIQDQYQLYGNAVPPQLIEWVLKKLVDGPGTRALAMQPREPELFDA